MVKRAFRKTTLREIRGSFGRYFAILAIVALGVGFFAGLKVTKEAMVCTTDDYFRENGLYDFRLISTLGLQEDDVEELQKEKFVEKAEGAYSVDVLFQMPSGNDLIAKVHSISNDINQITLLDGRMPEKPGECVADSRWMTKEQIGCTLTVSDDNKDNTKDMLTTKQMTVVGIVQSAYYINFERGNTTLGNGKITGFLYTGEDLFSSDYYTEIFLITDQTANKIYSKEYKDGIEQEEGILETKLNELAAKRYQDLKQEADEKIADASEELEDGKKELADKEQELLDAEQELADNEIKIADSEKKLDEKEQEVTDGEAAVATAKLEIQMQEEQVNMIGIATQREMMLLQLTGAKEEIAQKEAALAMAKKHINEGRDEIAEGKEKLAAARIEIADARPKIEEGKQDIAEGEQKLKNAKEELEQLKEPDSYVLTRDSNIGYACFENDSAIVEGIGNVFPVFFFLVAALVCITTMNRMVEEQRTQIGVMKALGYSESMIMGKYTFYAGSAAIIGCVSGFLIGSWLFPYVIWQAYHIMYTVKDIQFVFDGALAVISIFVSLICSVGATFISLHQELKGAAADLIRPKAPSSGKRVFLEHIGFIWKHLKFTSKVSIRNVFRYKKRFFMMVLGIGGCYGLLITGLGIRDSIADVADRQYSDIQTYDISVMFKEDIERTDRGTFESVIDDRNKYLYVDAKTVDVIQNGKTKSATLTTICPDDIDKVDKFIHFQDSKSSKTISCPVKGEAIITQKMADLLGIKMGDKIILRDPDLNETEVNITGIAKNYVFNYVYINEDSYYEMYQKLPFYNSAFVQTDGDVYQTSVTLGEVDEISSISVIADMKSRVDAMMKSLDYVVLLVIACAASLAFIVMYNLTNINITERLREIATMKVLGFYSDETAIYVFRENLILTLFGCLTGVFMGYALHRYVMYNINVEVVNFDVKILPFSYFAAVILTILFALIVDFALYFKLEKIHMAESLKSIE